MLPPIHNILVRALELLRLWIRMVGAISRAGAGVLLYLITPLVDFFNNIFCFQLSIITKVVHKINILPSINIVQSVQA